MAIASNIKGQQLPTTMVLSITLAAILTGFFFLKLVYQYGALSLQYWTFMTIPIVRFRCLETQFQTPTKTNWVNLSFVITGAVGTGWLYWMRNQFVW